MSPEEVKARILRACRKLEAEGGKVVQSPCGIDGEYCPLQAVCMEHVGGFGLMWFPWYEGPKHELGLNNAQVWSFIEAFDDKVPGTYTETFGHDPVFWHLGAEMRMELLEIR